MKLCVVRDVAAGIESGAKGLEAPRESCGVVIQSGTQNTSTIAQNI